MDWAVSQNQISAFFWFQRCSWSASEICAWRAERKRCTHLLLDTPPFPESFISLSSCCVGKTVQCETQGMKHSWCI